jgi:hypothetical protein
MESFCETIHNRDKATGRPPSGDQSPKQDPTPPKSAPDVHAFNLPVPNYNLQRRRWDFVLPWRKAIQCDLGSILRILRMNTQIPNINVVRSVWRRVKKGRIEVRDLKPVTDVKGGGGVKSESKSTTGDTGTTGTTGSH